MNQNDFKKSVKTAFFVLLKMELTSWDRKITFNSINLGKEYSEILRSLKYNYEEIYIAGIKYRIFNFLLEDYSYFQFWHDNKYEIRSLRYAYCPSPYEAINKEIFINDEIPLDDFIENRELLIEELEEVTTNIGIPPVRYDLALDDYKEATHPSSHFTVGGHNENRWPVSRIITPYLFVLFICKQYYPDKWFLMNTSLMTKDGFFNNLDQALAEEKKGSRLLDKSKFSSKDRLHLFFD